jgi:hypothetical protein
VNPESRWSRAVPIAVLVAAALVVSACRGSGEDEGRAAGDDGGPASAVDVSPLDELIDRFLDGPSSDAGAEVALAMGETGDERFGPWLLDLYRLGRSTRIDDAVTEALAGLSGIQPVGFRTDDYRQYGNWVYDEAVDPGAGYRRWKLELYGSIDDEFARLLEPVADDVLLARIQWGGVTRGGIPELNDPERVIARDADWMVDDELVLGLVVDEVAVAYPLRILGHHELANDEIAGVPISLVYCTLCRSGLAFDRRVGDRVLDFQTSGLLIESNKIMVDTQTDTLWRHQTGRGLAGPLAGEELPQFPVVTTTWSQWTSDHSATEVLAIPDPIFPADAGAAPERPPIAYDYEPGEAYRFYYEDPDVWFPILDTPGAFDLKEEVIGLEVGDDAVAVGVEALVAAGPRVFAVGDRSVALVPGPAGARAYEVTGSPLGPGPIEEPFDAGEDGLRLDDGTVGPRLAVPQLFWFAWYGRHPQTTWWPA